MDSIDKRIDNKIKFWKSTVTRYEQSLMHIGNRIKESAPRYSCTKEHQKLLGEREALRSGRKECARFIKDLESLKITLDYFN